MAENSKIEWTHHTFNPWIGCQKVGPGCDRCYAEAMMDARLGRVEWGPHGIRLVAIAPGTCPTEAAVARLRPGGMDHAGVPLRRAGKHEELTDLAAFLVSDHAGYITGECVVADGGRRLLGGARAGAQEMLDWTDEQWAQQRARTPSR